MLNQRGRWELAAVCVLLTLMDAVPARAGELEVPLRLDYLILNAAIAQKLYTAPGGRAEFFRGSDECQYFYAQKPRFVRHDSQLELDTEGDLSLGFALGGNCVSPIAWKGIIEADTAPRIDGRALRLGVTDLNFYNADRSKSEIAGRGFDLVKGNLIPQLEAFSYDLSPAMAQLDSLAASIPPTPQGEQARSALQSLRLGPAVVPEDDGVRVTLQLALPDSLTAPQMPAPITAAQAAAWRVAADNVANFLGGAAGQIRTIVPDQQLAGELGAIVDDSRNRAAQAAAQPPANRDPLPLFRDDWQRLRAIVKRAADQNLAGGHTLELLSFVTAGDTLFAIDGESPALGSSLASAALDELSRRIGSSAATGLD